MHNRIRSFFFFFLFYLFFFSFFSKETVELNQAMYSTNDMKFNELCSRLRDFFRLRNNFKPSGDQQ